MADPNPIVPYKDPFDNVDDLNLLDYDSDLFSDLPSDQDPNSHPHFSIPPPPANTGNIAGPSDPFKDPVWEIPNLYIPTSSQAGPSELCVGASSSNQGNSHPQNSNSENWRPLLNWPPPPIPYTCSCCQVLREIIHSKGNNVTKLEIHGRIGIISHAILEIRQNISSNFSIPHYQMIDFCKNSGEFGMGAKNVKKFLVDYCNERKQAGFQMMRDPLSCFYEAMSVGLDVDGDDSSYVVSSSSQEDDDNDDDDDDDEGSDVDTNNPLSISLSEQRTRAKNLTFEDLRQYFNLPMMVAASKLNICSTVVKKASRRVGVYRWPYRKIKSLNRKLSQQRSRMNEIKMDGAKRACCQAKIDELERQIKAQYHLDR